MFIFRTLISIALFALTASPAFALSCRRYSPQQAFQDASASPDRYVIVQGRLDFDPTELPVVDMNQQAQTPPDTIFNATLTGFSLTGGGFDARFVRSIQVNVQCYGVWCGSLSSGTEYLTFLKREGMGYLLETNPCGGFAFQNPSPEMLNDIHMCLLGEGCEVLE